MTEPATAPSVPPWPAAADGDTYDRATVEPTVGRTGHGGLSIVSYDWGGSGQPLLLLHPNGFCGRVFTPLAQRLLGPFRPIAVDFRGHGLTSAPPDGPDGLAFAAIARDVVAVLDHLGVREVVTIGVSLGGAIGILIDRLRPGLQTRLWLHEPIAFPFVATSPERLPAATRRATPSVPAATPDGPRPDTALVASKRRAVWPDRATVRASYANRAPLSELAPEVLDAYVQWGFVDQLDGTIRLACDPATEAALFASSPTVNGALDAWGHFPNMSVRYSASAGRTTTLPIALFEAAEAVIGPIDWLDTGHFGPLADLDLGERLARELLLDY